MTVVVKGNSIISSNSTHNSNSATAAANTTITQQAVKATTTINLEPSYERKVLFSIDPVSFEVLTDNPQRDIDAFFPNVKFDC